MPRWCVHGVCCATSEGLLSVSGWRRGTLGATLPAGGWRRTSSRFSTGLTGLDKGGGPAFVVDGPLTERGFLLGDSDPSRLCRDGVLQLVSFEEEVERVSQLSKLTFLLRLLFGRCFDMISAAFSTSPSV
jgi:hypothetical protein